jgi:hypothetical protein
MNEDVSSDFKIFIDVLNNAQQNLRTEPTCILDCELIQHSLRLENGLQIRLVWHSSMNENMKTYFRQASQILVNLITTKAIHKVLCLCIDHGLPESSTSLFTLPYSMLRDQYITMTHSSPIRTLILKSNLPVSNPLSEDSVFFLSSTQMQIFGLDTGQESFSNEIYINSQEEGIDLTVACLRELIETLGQITGFEDQGTKYRSILDLCNFSALHTRALEYEPNSFFSIDGGLTNISHLNRNVKENLSIADVVAMESLGFSIAPIQYIFDTIKIPLRSIIIPQLTNNFQHIIGPHFFQITPNLPQGLLFSTVDGSISGIASEISPLLLYNVTLQHPHAPELNIFGEFNLQVIGEEDLNPLSPAIIVAIVIGCIVVILLIVLSVIIAIKN